MKIYNNMETFDNTTLEQEIDNAYAALKKGGIIVYPTDTIWGIGCCATNKNAVEKIYRIKKRIAEKSFILLVSCDDELRNYVEEVPELVWDLVNNYTSPLTIIYPKAKNLPYNVMAPDGSVAIRITKDDFCKQLILKLGKPIVSTSANVSGDIAPLVYSMINDKILKKADYVVNYKRDKVTEVKPSTIARITKDGQIDILRS